MNEWVKKKKVIHSRLTAVCSLQLLLLLLLFFFFFFFFVFCCFESRHPAVSLCQSVSCLLTGRPTNQPSSIHRPSVCHPSCMMCVCVCVCVCVRGWVGGCVRVGVSTVNARDHGPPPVSITAGTLTLTLTLGPKGAHHHHHHQHHHQHHLRQQQQQQHHHHHHHLQQQHHHHHHSL